MAKYKILIGEVLNTNQASKTIFKSGSVLRRVGQAVGRVLNGADDMPENFEQLQNLLLNNVFGMEADKYSFLSRFGTPVRNYLKIQEGSYLQQDNEGSLSTRRYASLFLETAVISVDQPKNIVFTEVNGRNGSRKEYVSNGDFNIQITGELAGKGHSNYPAQEVSLLRDILASPEPLTVICPHLLTFGINTIVVKSFDFPQEEGFYSVQKFAISAASHAPVDIYVEESQKDLLKNKSRLAQIIDNAEEKLAELQKRVNDALVEGVDRGNSNI